MSFSVYVSQQVFLIGICLPLYVALVCLTSVTVAYSADTQLHSFVSRNERRKQLSQALVPNLDEGVWRYSPHPNYFGGKLWWWGLAIFGWNLDCGRGFNVALINSLCLAYVTVQMVDDRMLKQEYWAEAYKSIKERHPFGYLGSRHHWSRKRRGHDRHMEYLR